MLRFVSNTFTMYTSAHAHNGCASVFLLGNTTSFPEQRELQRMNKVHLKAYHEPPASKPKPSLPGLETMEWEDFKYRKLNGFGASKLAAMLDDDYIAHGSNVKKTEHDQLNEMFPTLTSSLIMEVYNTCGGSMDRATSHLMKMSESGQRVAISTPAPVVITPAVFAGARPAEEVTEDDDEWEVLQNTSESDAAYPKLEKMHEDWMVLSASDSEDDEEAAEEEEAPTFDYRKALLSGLSPNGQTLLKTAEPLSAHRVPSNEAIQKPMRKEAPSRSVQESEEWFDQKHSGMRSVELARKYAGKSKHRSRRLERKAQAEAAALEVADDCEH
eukprot:Colp12_sorted_trinity150504_noHs@7087